jgi:hypothetical protein
MSELTHEEFRAEARVVGGNPNPEELAATLAVLELALEQELAAGGGAAKPVSSWGRNGSQLRGEVRPGPGQWQAALRAGLN